MGGGGGVIGPFGALRRILIFFLNRTLIPYCVSILNLYEFTNSIINTETVVNRIVVIT